MIPLTNFFIGLGFLVILSVVDLLTFKKEKGFIPSVMTTSFLIVAFLYGVSINSGAVVGYGVLGALIGLLFTDLELWGGIADYKVFVAGAMLLSAFSSIVVYGFILTAFAVMIKGFLKLKIKGKNKQFPFIPVILLAFLIAGLLNL